MPPAPYIIGFLAFAGFYVLALAGTMGFAVIAFYVILPLLSAFIAVVAALRIGYAGKTSNILSFLLIFIVIASAFISTAPLHGVGYSSGMYFRVGYKIMPIISALGVLFLVLAFDRIVENSSNVTIGRLRFTMLIVCFFVGIYVLFPGLVAKLPMFVQFLLGIIINPMIPLFCLTVALWIVSEHFQFERWIFFVVAILTAYTGVVAFDRPSGYSPGRFREWAFILLPPMSLICSVALWRLSTLIREVRPSNGSPLVSGVR